MQIEKVYKSRQTGFTFIELVVVVILIGLLAAAALPRFLDLTEDAQRSSLEGVAGGFAAGIAMAHAQWKAKGNSTPAAVDAANKTFVNLDGKVIYMNENGWPANSDPALESSIGGTSAIECLEVWSSVFQSAPSATIDSNQRANNRYFVRTLNVNGDTACRYELIINQSSTAAATHYIDYLLATGEVYPRYPAE